MKETIATDDAAPPAGPYSQAVAAGDFVFCAGGTPARTDGTLVHGTFSDQARAALDNLSAVAEAAGTTLSSAVRTWVYLKDFTNNFQEMNDLFREYFGPEPPARTTLPVEGLGFAVEIDVILYRPR